MLQCPLFAQYCSLDDNLQLNGRAKNFVETLSLMIRTNYRSYFTFTVGDDLVVCNLTFAGDSVLCNFTFCDDSDVCVCLFFCSCV